MKWRIGKIFAQFVCGFIYSQKLRRKVRWKLDPCSPVNLINYFRKKYLPLVSVSLTEGCRRQDGSEYIFQCWLQGVDNAPNLVKNCIETVGKFKGNKKHIIITMENLSDWIVLPDFILEKYKKGKIGNAHFADIIRVYLLAKYGGYWIDATMLMTAELPKIIDNTEFFMFHSSGKWHWSLINNCFIHSVAGHPLILAWRDIMTEYWRRENRALEYFVSHLLFRTVLLRDDLKAEFDKMPVILQDDNHKLSYFLADSLSEEEIICLLKSYFIHKLTYKLNKDVFDNPKSVAYFLSQRKS